MIPVLGTIMLKAKQDRNSVCNENLDLLSPVELWVRITANDGIYIQVQSQIWREIREQKL